MANEAQGASERPFTVVLASGSPRRRELLEQAGVAFTVRTPVTPVDETLEPDLAANPEEAAKKLAERKAGAVVQEVLAEDFTGMLIVIGADTMVVKDGAIFGKPRSLSDGKHMLRSLSGATHEVITGVSVWMIAAPAADDISLGFRTFADTSRVTFRDLSDAEIDDYLRKGESFDKAGARHRHRPAGRAARPRVSRPPARVASAARPGTARIPPRPLLRAGNVGTCGTLPYCRPVGRGQWYTSQ